MEQDVAFQCDCGTVRGHLSAITPHRGTHVTCYCSECRSAEVYLDQPDPEKNGVDLFQTTVDRVTIDTGLDQLRAFAFRPGKLARWYAGCCKAPMFNTLDKPWMGFVTLHDRRVTDTTPFGPIVMEGFKEDASGRQRQHHLWRLIWGVVKRTTQMQATGRWRQTPFHTSGGETITPIHVLSDVEKSVLPLEIR